MASLFIVPIYIAQMSEGVKTIDVVDESGIFFKLFPETENINFNYLNTDINTAKNNFENANHSAILYLPKDIKENPSSGKLFFEKQPSLIVKSYIENNIRNGCRSNDLHVYFYVWHTSVKRCN